MDVKEKLVELIAQKVCDTWSESCDEWLPHDCGKCYANDCHIADVVDHMISHGVTVQEWISIDEPPKKNGYYLVYTETGEIIRGYYKGCYWLAGNDVVTHWQPMPQPPKGE